MFPPEMDIFSFPALVDVHIRRYQDNASEKDEFSWTRSPHICTQLNRLRQLRLTGHVGSVEQVITLLEGAPNLVKLSLDIFVDYQTLLPALFPYNAPSLIQHVQDLEIHLQHEELAYPPFPPNSILLCLFRFRDLIDFTHQPHHLKTLRVFVLQSSTCEKVLHELDGQFLSSSLQTLFESKDNSSRDCSDQGLIKNNLINYTLY